MAINYETGEEEDDYFDSSLYDEGSIPVASAFPTQDLVAQDQALTAQLPTAAPAGLAQFSPAPTPGSLTIRGAGPGMINVNGELQPSRAAPQPLPWWIAAADQFKEQRRQEDEQYRQLQNLLQMAPTVEAQKGVARAKQLQAQIAYKSAVQSGVPPGEALSKYGMDLFPTSAPTRLRAMMAGQRTGLTESEKLARESFNYRKEQDIKRAQVAAAKQGDVEATKRKVERERRQYSEAKSDLKEINKWIEENPEQRSKDPTTFRNKITERNKLQDKMAKLSGVDDDEESPTRPISPAGPVSTPAARAAVGPKNKVQLANQLASQHPDWDKAKIIAEVRKQLP